MKRKSKKGNLIEKTLHYIREIKKIETGNRCEICGRHQDTLPMPLSSFHILRRGGEHKRLILYKPNILLACWETYRRTIYCHNIWHDCDAREQKYKDLVKKIEIRLGKPLKDYEDDLKRDAVILPRLTGFQIECYYYSYKKEYENLCASQ